MGVGRFCRVFVIPLAEARLLAIEDEMSRTFVLPTRESLGGPAVFSGEVDLCSWDLFVSAVVAAADASLVAGRGSISSTVGFS